MILIKFFNDKGRLQGIKTFNSIPENYLELKSWIISGNTLTINNIEINTIDALKNVLKGVTLTEVKL